MSQTSLSPETSWIGKSLDSLPKEHQGTGRGKKRLALGNLYINSVKTQRINDSINLKTIDREAIIKAMLAQLGSS